MTDPISTSVPPITDPRPALRAAIETTAPLIASISPEQMSAPSPCGAFDVEGLLAHLAAVLERVRVIGSGGDVFTVSDSMSLGPDETWADRWAREGRRAAQAWDDDARLTDEVRVPWATLPGADAVAIYVNEITVHTWDLAQATGRQPAWDPLVLDVALAAVHDQLPTPERAEIWAPFAASLPPGATFDPPFGDAVPVPADAATIDRLVAWNGRRP